MTSEIRRAALRAAAKTAIVASVAGCAGSRHPATAAPDPSMSCPQWLDSLEMVDISELPEGDPLKERSDVYGAFADLAARRSDKTLTCCTEELTQEGSSAKHRWACCSALDQPSGDTVMACTPWGPPCPPSMA